MLAIPQSKNIVIKFFWIMQIMCLLFSISLLCSCEPSPSPFLINKSGENKIIYRNGYSSILKNNAEDLHLPLRPIKEKRIISMRDCPELEHISTYCEKFPLVKIGEFSEMVLQLEKYKKDTGKTGVYVLGPVNSIKIMPYMKNNSDQIIEGAPR